MESPASSRRYRTGFSSNEIARHPWPADCGIQGGDNGIVFTNGAMSEAFENTDKGIEVIAAAGGLVNPPGSYRTAFFEAFPRNPSSFLRGEGKTLAEAEDDCWKAWQRILSCPGHEFERHQYRCGAGICRHCDLFSTSAFLTILDHCVVCGEASNGTIGGPDLHGRMHCKRCYPLIPESEKSDLHKMLDQMRASR